MKSKVDKLDVNMLVPCPVDSSKVSNVAKNDKINNVEDKITDITNLATNTTLNAKINVVKNKIPSITNVATTATLNTKLNEVKNKIPNITNLASTTALTTIENEISNVSNFAKKKTDYNTKFVNLKIKLLLDHDYDEYITTQ